MTGCARVTTRPAPTRRVSAIRPVLATPVVATLGVTTLGVATLGVNWVAGAGRDAGNGAASCATAYPTAEPASVKNNPAILARRSICIFEACGVEVLNWIVVLQKYQKFAIN